MKKNVAVFSSGRGGNFNNLCDYFNNSDRISICLLVTNNLGSTSKEIADRHNIETIYVNNEIMSSGVFEKSLIKRNICFLVLAGFILKLPVKLVGLFEKKIINLHPSLLPKFGGRGMYGDNVHKAVLKSKERFTGISIHFVDEIYDNGEVIFQKSCKIDRNETILTLREKIRLLEYRFFPKVIEETVLDYER